MNKALPIFFPSILCTLLHSFSHSLSYNVSQTTFHPPPSLQQTSFSLRIHNDDFFFLLSPSFSPKHPPPPLSPLLSSLLNPTVVTAFPLLPLSFSTLLAACLLAAHLEQRAARPMIVYSPDEDVDDARSPMYFISKLSRKHTAVSILTWTEMNDLISLALGRCFSRFYTARI